MQNEKSRAEHLEWCKTRAMELLNSGDEAGAFASMGSDLEKHPETAGHAGIELGLMLMLSGMLKGYKPMKDFILGFN